MEKRNLLIIEDNIDLAQLLALHLRDLNMQVTVCNDGPSGLNQALQQHYDLIILDLMLPGLDGLSVCQKLRQQTRYVPIFILTSKASEYERVLGLEMGADDYITKPYSITELLARIKAFFRRAQAMQQQSDTPADSVIQHGNLSIDFSKHLVNINNQTIELTVKEFDLLSLLAREPGRVFTRAQLLDQVWGYGHDGYEHTVNSHINRLRVKIEQNPAQPRYILTVWGVGYKFNDTLPERGHES